MFHKKEGGEATYPDIIRPGDEIVAGDKRRYRVVDLVAVDLVPVLVEYRIRSWEGRGWKFNLASS